MKLNYQNQKLRRKSLPQTMHYEGSVSQASGTPRNYLLWKWKWKTFHTKKEFRPDFVAKHAECVINLVDRALLLASQQKPKKKKKSKMIPHGPMPVTLPGNSGPSGFATARATWGRNSKQRKPSYKDQRKLNSKNTKDEIKRPTSDTKLKNSSGGSTIEEPPPIESLLLENTDCAEADNKLNPTKAESSPVSHENDDPNEFILIPSDSEEQPIYDPLKITDRIWYEEFEKL